jgi:hypothetical protein
MRGMPIKPMGHFTAVGMRQKIDAPNALVINTCSDNDTAERGSPTRWSWSNPTNRRFTHPYHGFEAVSVECLWQGTKLFTPDGYPDEATLSGQWRRGKAKRPLGAYAGAGQPLITDPGEARRRIYLPAFARLIDGWIEEDDTVRGWVLDAQTHDGPVFLRDFDTGRGIDRNGPMSHAWVLATRLNTGEWPS